MKLFIVIEVSDEVDTMNVDPHDFAADFVSEYGEWARANGEPGVTFVAAEWAGNAFELMAHNEVTR